jgi:hypothetical protein
MELLLYYPADTQPKHRHFDGPPLLGAQQAVGEDAEEVPGFTSISRDGVIHRCVAYCDKGGKQNGRPINAWATALWHAALKREGYDRGLRRPDGTIIDWLAGNVVVICSTEIVEPKYVLIHS